MRVPSKHDPFRPVNWRWERARWLREHGKYLKRAMDDEFTDVAKKFQSEEDRVRNPVDSFRLEAKYPGVFNAKELYEREERDARWTIEARLLAGESYDRIATRHMTSPEVIFWYEKLFFNVLPCLNAPDYIVNVVIGSAVHHGLTDREYDLLWKLFGYFAKGFVLDFLITTFAGAAAPDRVEGAPSYMSDDNRLSMKRKGAIAARLMPLHNTFTLQIILETHAKMLEIEKLGGEGGGADAMMECIGAMMVSLGGADGRGGGLLYAGNKPSYVDTPALADYDGRAAELRVNEQLALTVGSGSLARPEELDWAFPEPPPSTDQPG